MLDFLQRTLGKRAGGHNHHAAQFALFFRAVWSASTVRPHGRLGDYPGAVVAWRGTGVHVSAPPSQCSEIAESLATRGIRDLQTPEFWSAFARSVDRDLIGPSTHHYLDEDPGVPAAVVRVESTDLLPMRAAVTPDAWLESGFDDDAQAWFGFARWRARTRNRGSLGAARRLGFELWCTQLAIR